MNLDHHPNQRLSNVYTQEELLKLRDEGMSNAEIAEYVGFTAASVYRYIGPQGVRKRRNKSNSLTGDKETWVDAETYCRRQKAKEEYEQRRLIPTRYQGKKLEIIVDRALEEVVFIGNGEITVSFDDLHDFMGDVAALSRELDRCNKEDKNERDLV